MYHPNRSHIDKQQCIGPTYTLIKGKKCRAMFSTSLWGPLTPTLVGAHLDASNACHPNGWQIHKQQYIGSTCMQKFDSSFPCMDCSSVRRRLNERTRSSFKEKKKKPSSSDHLSPYRHLPSPWLSPISISLVTKPKKTHGKQNPRIRLPLFLLSFSTTNILLHQPLNALKSRSKNPSFYLYCIVFHFLANFSHGCWVIFWAFWWNKSRLSNSLKPPQQISFFINLWKP